MRSIVRSGSMWLLLLGVLAVAGCGGSDTTTSHGAATPTSASTSTTTASSRRSFVVQADEVCSRINTEILAVKAKGGTAAEVKRVVPRIISIERKGIAALEQLRPPASLGADWLRMLGYRRTLAGELADLLSAAEKNDGTSIKPLAASKKRVHARLTQTAKAHGFKDCAKVGRVG
jgi:hypothetical protein